MDLQQRQRASQANEILQRIALQVRFLVKGYFISLCVLILALVHGHHNEGLELNGCACLCVISVCISAEITPVQVTEP